MFAKADRTKKVIPADSFYEALIKSSPDGITVVDSHGDILVWNKRQEEITGLSAKQTVGEKIWDVQYGLLSEAHKISMPKEFLKEQALDLFADHDHPRLAALEEQRIMLPDGSSKHVESFLFLIPTPDGVLLGSFIRDISEAHNIKQKIHESEELYRTLYDNAPLSFQSLDEAGHFLAVNPMWLQTLGYDEDEVIGKYYGDFLHPDWKPIFEKRFPKFKERGRVSNAGFKIRHKDGSYLDILFEGCIITHPDGSFKQTYCVFKDVTEQRVAEEELFTREQMYRGLYESAGLGVGYYDTDFKVVSYNPLALADMGMEAADVEGKTLAELFGAEAAKVYEERLAKAMTSEEPQGYEDQIELPTGEKWYLSVYSAVHDQHGEIQGIQIISSNITELKQGEALLRESESLHSSVVSALSEGLVVQDKDDKILMANQSAADILNLSLDQLHGRDSYDPLWKATTLEGSPVKPEDHPSVVTMRTGKPVTGFIMQVQVGEEKPTIISINSRPVKDEDDQVVRTVTTFTDITEQQAALKTIRESQKVLHEAERIAKMGSWRWNLETDELHWSRGMFLITGRNPDEGVPGIDEYQSHIHPDDMDQYSKTLKDGLEQGGRFSGQHRFRHWTKDQYITFKVTGEQPPDMQAGANRLIGTVQDITETLRTQQELHDFQERLKQSEKLEAIGTMIGGIAHDFNNLIQGLLLNVEVVKSQLESGSELAQDFEQIVGSVDRARHLVQQILTFSRKNKVDLHPCALASRISEEIKLIRNNIPDNVTLNEEIIGPPGMIMCDQTHIHQLLLNLIRNACQAIGDEQGEINVSIETHENAPDPDTEMPGYVQLVIEDTGGGMDAETREKIFDPFFTTKGVGQGTGLGLSSVHGIVKQMSGSIEVESELGKGTRFILRFPITQHQPDVPNFDTIAEKEIGTKRILLVDDESAILNAGKRILDREGHKVSTAKSGDEALQLIKKGEQVFDLVITDMTMPGITGEELFQEIQGIQPDLKVIISTGNLRTVETERLRESGILAFLQKPWTRDTLMAVLKKL